jgi:hypothetical protein
MRPHEIEIADNLIAYSAVAIKKAPFVKTAFEAAKRVGNADYASNIAASAVLSRAFVMIVDELESRGVPFDTMKTRAALVELDKKSGGEAMDIIAIHNVLHPHLVDGVWKDQFDGMKTEEMVREIVSLRMAGYPVFVKGQTDTEFREAREAFF